MKTNEDLQKDVQQALKWEPLLHAAEIGVIVNDGIVTLTGTVDNYSKKIEAENATKNVAGVKAIVEEIKVVLSNSKARTDSDLAIDVVKALQKNRSLPFEKLKVKVEEGIVTLEGKIAWDFQRGSARKSIEMIQGVKGFIDRMKLKSEKNDLLEKNLIKEAFGRHWSLNREHIDVQVSGTHVTLKGYVNSLYQKEEAGHLAWKIPGVWSLDNQLVVEYRLASH